VDSPPPAPVTPPPTVENLPQRQDVTDFAAILKDAFTQAIRDANTAADISTTPGDDPLDAMTGRELVKADARNRSWRTLLQGLGIDLFFAIVALAGTLTHIDALDNVAWSAFFALVGKTLIQTAVAYFMRLRVAPTIRTPGEKYVIAPLPRPVEDDDERTQHP
jgi:hypothetical protein